jgi:hypothetical protein
MWIYCTASRMGKIAMTSFFLGMFIAYLMMS